jgi:ferredoxin-NADP reductase
VLLVAGGSGVVPLMSMIRQRAASGDRTPTRLLYSSRTYEDVIYRGELEQPADGLEVFHTLTRSQPPGWTGYSRRIDKEMIGEVAWPAARGPRVFVCGSTRFVGTAADGLVAMGYPAQSIRTERFGATG